jgi:aryl carrier-like protein
LPEFLAGKLASQVIPAEFVTLDELPRTLSGKIARKALEAIPAPAVSPPSFRAPGTPVEEALHEVWTELLAIPRLSVEEDLLSLGGSSLTAMRLILRVRDVFGVELTIHDLFSVPTVAAMARLLEDRLIASANAGSLGDLLSMVESLDDQQAERLLRASGGLSSAAENSSAGRVQSGGDAR